MKTVSLTNLSFFALCIIFDAAFLSKKIYTHEYRCITGAHGKLKKLFQKCINILVLK
jgi:hypothetical protein